ncbi:MAG: sulfotransferase [Rhodobacter sp.]|nr:sulfotransferase [Paracoccaceae bacterium]MCC0074087.1 sulfotransferase [Rhodobacter sp.]
MTRSSAADILCIGAQRAMTSWLHHGFSSHPGVWAFPNFEPLTSTSKEAHYWDWNRKRGPDWYRVLMRPLDDGLASLDFTPEYAFLDAAQIAECKALNPTARVIYILRDPLARALSAIRMRTVWATKNAPAETVHLRFDHEFRERCRHANLIDHGAYAANIRRWRQRYPDLLVLNFEDLRADPRAGLRRALDHCGLTADSLDADRNAQIDERADRRIWVTPSYGFDADCVEFLHGMLWPEYEATQAETGLTFTEGAAILEALS